MRPRGWFLQIMTALICGVVGGALFHHAVIPPARADSPRTTTIVTAQEFRLVTSQGETRAQLALWDGQRPILHLADGRCSARVSFGISDLNGQPFLVFYDDDCRRRVTMDLIPDGLPQLTFRDEANTPRARLHLLKDGSPIFRLFDPNGQTMWAAARE